MGHSIAMGEIIRNTETDGRDSRRGETPRNIEGPLNDRRTLHYRFPSHLPQKKE